MDNQNLYIHMQVSLFNHFIRYKTGSYKLGNNLLDFIYFDMDTILNDLATKSDMREVVERIRKLHPYFAVLSQDTLELMIKNCEDKSNRNFNIYKVKELQERYLKLIDIVLNHYNVGEQTGEYQYLLKYKLFSSSRLLGNEDGELCIDYFVMGFEDCLYIELMEMLKSQTLIKKCKNCNRYFIPQKANIDYCSRVIQFENKTCQEVGYTKTFAKAVKNDDLLQAYTRAYKAHYARMSKPRKKISNMSREAFKAWHVEAKEKLKQARAGELDANVFKIWLKQ